MGLISFVKGVFRRMLNFRSIGQAEQVKTALSPEMTDALQTWSDLYMNQAPWLKPGVVKSMNLPAFICSELARQVVLEMNVKITGKDANGQTTDANGEEIQNERSIYLAEELNKLLATLRQKLEQGCAAGGMIIKPYPANGHLFFDVSLDWDIYPVAFDNAGNLQDVIIPDFITDGDTYYTRLERHTLDGDNVIITNKAYKSTMKESLGKEIPLTAVDRWKDLAPSVTVTQTGGQLFGWYRAATANTSDLHSPMGSSVFSKAVDAIREADEQYSRLVWEFEGSELAIDVDPTALRPKQNGQGVELPKLNERLFRGVDLATGNGEDLYKVYSPAIRDTSLLNGLNTLLQRVEDLCGISRGTLSDANEVAKTATELTIQKQRSYATVSDNQKALEYCLKDVIRAMDLYATLYGLAPEGEYDVSFDWDDSIMVDSQTRNTQMMTYVNAGLISKTEFRMWCFGETEAQAKAALEAIQGERDLDLDDVFKVRNE